MFDRYNKIKRKELRESSERDNKVITEFDIAYGKPYGIHIKLKDKSLIYRNTTLPSISYMRFPEEYLEKKVRILTDDELEEILYYVNNSGYQNWKSDSDADIIYIGASYNIFNCRFEDGSVYSYKSRYMSDAQFYELGSKIREFCDFVTLDINYLSSADLWGQTQLKKAVFCKKCNNKVLLSSNYCTVCGDKIQDYTLDAGLIEIDEFETSWSCSECNCYNVMSYKYCINCGNKSPYKLNW